MQPVWVILHAIEVVKGRHPRRLVTPQARAIRVKFHEVELVKLTMAVIAINGWNRLAIAFRPEVGKYQPRAKAE